MEQVTPQKENNSEQQESVLPHLLFIPSSKKKKKIKNVSCDNIFLLPFASYICSHKVYDMQNGLQQG